MYFLKLPHENWSSFVARTTAKQLNIAVTDDEHRKQVYVAFGDASSGRSGTYYGFLLVPAQCVQKAENSLIEIKRRFGGDERSRLHCREMFGGNALLKSEWRHLSQTQVVELCRSVLSEFEEFGVKYALGVMPVTRYPERLRFRGKEGHEDIVHHIDDKWRELWTYYRAAMMLDPISVIAVPDPTIIRSPKNQPWWRMQVPLVEPGFKVSKVYLDNENTKVQWFSKRFQWQTIARDLVVKGTLGPSFLPIQDRGDTPKHALLDVADIFVWNVARAFGSNPIQLLAKETDVHTVVCAPVGDEIILGENF